MRWRRCEPDDELDGEERVGRGSGGAGGKGWLGGFAFDESQRGAADIVTRGSASGSPATNQISFNFPQKKLFPFPTRVVKLPDLGSKHQICVGSLFFYFF